MTKSFLMFATCGLVIASCSKVESVNENPGTDNANTINFVTSTTRGAISDLTLLQGGFHVYGANNSTAGWHEGIDAHEYKHDGTNWAWNSISPAWPIGGEHYPMKFYGHHPKTAAGFTPTADATGTTSASTSVTAEIEINANAGTQIDYLGATNTTNTKPPTSKLAMDFDHIVSKVNFGIITGLDVTAYVNVVNINALVNKGIYNYGTATWDFGTNTATNNYEYFTGVGAIDFNNTTTTIDFKTPFYAAGHANHFMLIPQNATPAWDGIVGTADANGNATGVTGSYIGMSYRAETMNPTNEDAVGYKMRSSCVTDTEWAGGTAGYIAYNSTGGTYDAPLYVKVGFPLGGATLTWVKGKGYTYNMKIGTTDATGGLYLSKYYYDEAGMNTKIPVDGNPVITDPVASGDIHFDVSVGDWDADTETDL